MANNRRRLRRLLNRKGPAQHEWLPDRPNSKKGHGPKKDRLWLRHKLHEAIRLQVMPGVAGTPDQKPFLLPDQKLGETPVEERTLAEGSPLAPTEGGSLDSRGADGQGPSAK